MCTLRALFTLFTLECLSQVTVNLQHERPDSGEGLTPARRDPLIHSALRDPTGVATPTMLLKRVTDWWEIKRIV